MGFAEKIRHLSTRDVSIIMLLVTLLVPVASMFHGGHRFEEDWVVDVSIVAPLWVYLPPYWDLNSGTYGVYGGGFHVLNPIMILNSSIIWLFNALFAVQVVRFCENRASKRAGLLIGGLSLLLPSLQALMGVDYVMDFFYGTGIFVYVGPIPIQLIVGLILMRFAGPWEVQVPWEEDSESWWEKNNETGKQSQ